MSKNLGDSFTEVKSNLANGQDRARDDYDNHAEGVLGETAQNATDAWCENRARGILDENQDLVIQYLVDTERNKFEVVDNAGGMSETVYTENFYGLDTPSDYKQDGAAGGSYGRGIHLIATLGVNGEYQMYSETHHGEFYKSQVLKRDAGALLQGPLADPEGHLDGQYGTYIRVDGAKSDVVNELSDWDFVESYFQMRFHGLLSRDDVRIEYVIDGEIHSPEPIDLSQFTVLDEQDCSEFEYKGDTYQVSNFTIYDASSADVEAPFKGVSMMKRNEMLGDPFMQVHHYKVRKIPSVQQEKMFGFCDATELCPEFEDNAHNSLQSEILGQTGIREVLQELHDEHYRTDKSTAERSELGSQIKQGINSELSQFNDLVGDEDEDGIPTEEPGEDGPDDEPDDESVSELEDDDTNDEEDDISEPTLDFRCEAGKLQFDEGESVPLSVTVENPPSADISRYTIDEVKIFNTSDVTAEARDTTDIQVDSNDIETEQFRPMVDPEPGVYRFSAVLKETPENKTALSQMPAIQSSSIEFKVGDVDDNRGATSSTNGEQTVSTRRAFVDNVNFNQDGTTDWRVLLAESDSGAYSLTINIDRPEWKEAIIEDEESSGDEEVDTNRRVLGVSWAVQSILRERVIEYMYAELDGITNDEGDLISDTIADMLDSNADKADKVLENQYKEKL